MTTAFWTVMLITLAVPDGEVQMRLLYTSEEACSAAMLHIEEVLDPALPVLAAQCIRSPIMSASARPIARPRSMQAG